MEDMKRQLLAYHCPRWKELPGQPDARQHNPLFPPDSRISRESRVAVRNKTVISSEHGGNEYARFTGRG